MLKDAPEDKAVFAATDIRFRNKPKGKVTATPRPASDLRTIITKKREAKANSSHQMKGDLGDNGTRLLPGTSGSKVIQVHNSTFSNCSIQLTTN